MGFKDGHIFQMINPKDKCAIQVDMDAGGAPRESLLVTGLSKNASNQEFKTELLTYASNEFRVIAVVGEEYGMTLVWDYVPGDRYIRLNTRTNSINQIWTTHPVYQGKDKIVFIKSSDGLALRSMGPVLYMNGGQIELVAHNPSDPFQHWQLQATTCY